MLNCTDLECILHNHHYYAHLHQGQPHQPSDHALSTTADDVRDGIQTSDNDTEDSLQLFSHLDPPVDSVYMICGVLIAMILVGVIIVLLAVTISKLRKREDHGNDQSHTEQPSVVQTATPVSAIVSTTTTTSQTIITTNGDIRNNGIVNNGAIITASELSNGIIDGNTTFVTETTGEQFIWQFPPPYPPLTPPPQYTLYNDQDTLVHGLQADRTGFAKGIKKNIGGRWRRLVKRKPETETCAIPPELKDQLKTIYVY